MNNAEARMFYITPDRWLSVAEARLGLFKTPDNIGV
jgi:hypothetical protein